MVSLWCISKLLCHKIYANYACTVCNEGPIQNPGPEDFTVWLVDSDLPVTCPLIE